MSPVNMASMAAKKKPEPASVHLNFMCTEAEATYLRRIAKREKTSLSGTVRGLVTGRMEAEREARRTARAARQAES